MLPPTTTTTVRLSPPTNNSRSNARKALVMPASSAVKSHTDTIGFPRHSWIEADYGFVPMKEQSFSRALGAARDASQDWARAAANGTWGDIDSLCFRLAVFDKAYILYKWWRRDVGEPVSTRKDWFDSLSDCVDEAYEEATKALEDARLDDNATSKPRPKSDFPSFSEVEAWCLDAFDKQYYRLYHADEPKTEANMRPPLDPETAYGRYDPNVLHADEVYETFTIPWSLFGHKGGDSEEEGAAHNSNAPTPEKQSDNVVSPSSPLKRKRSQDFADPSSEVSAHVSDELSQHRSLGNKMIVVFKDLGVVARSVLKRNGPETTLVDMDKEPALRRHLGLMEADINRLLLRKGRPARKVTAPTVPPARLPATPGQLPTRTQATPARPQATPTRPTMRQPTPPTLPHPSPPPASMAANHPTAPWQTQVVTRQLAGPEVTSWTQPVSDGFSFLHDDTRRVRAGLGHPGAELYRVDKKKWKGLGSMFKS